MFGVERSESVNVSELNSLQYSIYTVLLEQTYCNMYKGPLIFIRITRLGTLYTELHPEFEDS